MKKEPDYKLIIIIICTVLILLGSGIYFYISWKNYQLKEEQYTAELEKQKQAEVHQHTIDTARAYCIQAADDDYNSLWNKECSNKNLNDDCQLPTDIANRLDDIKEKDKADCYNEYPSN